MKRKFFSVLLALVLVLSFSMVTAVPVAAQATLNVVPFTFTEISSGTAAWSDAEHHTGSYSVKMYAPASTGGYGQVAMDLDMAFADLDDFSVWVEGGETAQALPLLIIEFVESTLPTSANLSGGNNHVGGEDVDLSGSTRVNISSQPGQSEELSDTLMSDAIDGWEKYGTHDDATIDAGTGAYWTIYDYDTGPYDYFTWAEIQTIFAGATVTEVKVQLRYPQAPAAVESTVYIDDIAINGTTYYGKIQDAIDTATAAGDTIVAAAGTYTEDLTIPDTKTNLELVGATGATIKGVTTTADGSWPLSEPNIDISASGVKIHGFTIEGPDAVASKYASQMLIGASDVEIYDNDFKTHTQASGHYSVVIQTIRKVVIEGMDISGLNIHDNTFDDLGDGAVGYDGIFINIDAGTGLATIADNVFTGSLFRAISVERSNMVISGNSIITDLAPWTSGFAGGYQGMFIGCFEVEGEYPAQSDVSITGNTVKGATTSEGFAQGIRVGHTQQTDLTNMAVSRNTVQDCDEGITVRADATGVTVNYNDIRGNDVGVQNDDTGVELDAQYNWYGGVAGPPHATNPYVTEAAGNDSVSNDVDFLPWMIHTELVSGWNIYSTPIAPGAASNTIAKALDLWTTDTGSYTIGWYFNGATQAWVQVLSTTPLQPMQAVYLNMSANATIDVAVSAEHTSPPQAVMSAGWNLIGPSALEPMHVDVALLSAKFGAGAPDLWGYSQVHSPALHQTLWTFQRVDAYVDEDFVPTEGYWVHMVNAGLLAGFTSTPIEP